MNVCAPCTCRCPGRPDGVGFPGPGITGSCEPPNASAGNLGPLYEPVCVCVCLHVRMCATEHGQRSEVSTMPVLGIERMLSDLAQVSVPTVPSRLPEITVF